MILQEKLRPKTWDQLKGLNQTWTGSLTQKDRLRRLAENDRAACLIFIGPSGTGKDSATYLYASTYLKCPIEDIIPDESGESVHHKFKEINASDDRGIDTIRDEAREFASLDLVGDEPRRILYFNEANGLTKAAFMALKNITEKFSYKCIFIFSSNDKSLDPAIFSRSAVFYFNPIPLEEFREWFDNACKSENIKYNTVLVESIYNYYNGDLRRVLTDFVDTYRNTDVMYWKPNKDLAKEIFDAKDPSARFLQIIKKETIDPDILLKELFELNNYKNAHLFVEASIALQRCHPTIPILDILQNALVKEK